MATSVREVVSFMWFYIIYKSLLIQVYVKKRKKKERKKRKKERKKDKKYHLYIPSYHYSWGTCMDVTSCYIEYI